MNEQEKFLNDLEPKEDESILDQTIEPEKVEKTEEPEEADEMKLRNRREKRLHDKWQAEHDANISLAARLSTMTEVQKLTKDVDSEYLKGVEKIYGSETPEAIAATELLKKALLGVKEESKRESLETWREEQRQANEAIKNEEKQLDSMIEEIEDESNVILSESQKKGFFSMLEKMSPKDNNGNVLHYADHHAVWDIYQSKIQKTDNRAKDLSSRSMVSSGTSKESKLDEDSTARFLKDNGII